MSNIVKELFKWEVKVCSSYWKKNIIQNASKMKKKNKKKIEQTVFAFSYLIVVKRFSNVQT